MYYFWNIQLQGVTSNPQCYIIVVIIVFQWYNVFRWLVYKCIFPFSDIYFLLQRGWFFTTSQGGGYPSNRHVDISPGVGQGQALLHCCQNISKAHSAYFPTKTQQLKYTVSMYEYTNTTGASIFLYICQDKCTIFDQNCIALTFFSAVGRAERANGQLEARRSSTLLWWERRGKATTDTSGTAEKEVGFIKKWKKTLKEYY